MSDEGIKADTNAEELDKAVPVGAVEDDYQLTDGRPISLVKQWYLLFCKRFRILRRRYIPYVVAIVFVIAGAGFAPLLIKSSKDPITCPASTDLVDDSNSRSRSDLASSARPRILFGPPGSLNDTRLAQIAQVYSHSRTAAASCDPKFNPYCSDYGYHSTSQVKDSLVMVNTYEEFIARIKVFQDPHQLLSNPPADLPANSSSEGRKIDGGIWIDDDATILATNIDHPENAARMLNFLDNLLTDVPIATGYSSFSTTPPPHIFVQSALIFIVYYGLIMASYPAFFALYPTNERISNVRSMQYSNGIRPLPLWLSHLAFDAIFVVIISSVATGLLSASTPVWFGLGYIWIVLILYGLSATLLSYVISMIAKSGVTAWISKSFQVPSYAPVLI